VAKQQNRKKNPILMKFAKTVRTRRYELGLTQEELAEASDLHVNYIGGIERATRNPSLLILVKLSNALQVELGSLLKE